MATTVLIFDKKTDNNCASAWRFLTSLCRPLCNYDLAFAYTKFSDYVYVVVNFLSQLIFIFLLFWGMVMYADEFQTKEKQKLTEIKN